MTKEQFFNSLNSLASKIESAISAHEFALVEKYDIERQTLILAAKRAIKPDGDIRFLDDLLKCSQDNLNTIACLQSEIKNVSRSNSATLNAIIKYKRSI